MIFQADLSGKKEHQQMVDMILVSSQEQHARLHCQLTDKLFAFQLWLLLHSIMFCQGDGTYAAQMYNKQSKNFNERPSQGDFHGRNFSMTLKCRGIGAVAYVCAVICAADVVF